MKKCFLLLLLFLLFDQVQAQSDALANYNEQRLQITRIGMLTLGGWAIGNMGVSGALMSNTSGSRYYFHQMNVFWNVINIGLAGFGYYNAATADPSAFTLAETIQEQHSIEKLLLFNAGLDVAYLAGGFYLLERSRRESDQAERWKGYGQSLLLQGGFLLLFDAVLYAIVQQPSSELFTLLSSVQITPGGIGFVYRF
ncbi:DUF6992 family protein [Tunicatimonas pelagia]|uniref:DUF6992 family protein n=1 Tax=Tunicatimonas pelagia TaxID=931531 RepID=UPI002665518E|nr:hypothetical protein [Tunicatimonas pelagia]WKN41823.1 hypothetical protein P0M28_22550 [Tunicatimonas pelagia]